MTIAITVNATTARCGTAGPPGQKLHEHWWHVETYQGGSPAIRKGTCNPSTRVWEKRIRLDEVWFNINNYQRRADWELGNIV